MLQCMLTPKVSSMSSKHHSESIGIPHSGRFGIHESGSSEKGNIEFCVLNGGHVIQRRGSMFVLST